MTGAPRTVDARQARIDDLTELAHHGETPAAAAMRLGISEDTLERWANRNCRDVWAQLMRNLHAPGRIPTGRIAS